MSKVTSINREQETIDTACMWVAKLDRDLTSSELQALKVWLNESKSNEETFLKMVQLWDKIDALSKLSDLFEYKPANEPSQRNPILAMAASFAFISILAITIVLNGSFLSGNDTKQIVLFEAKYSTDVGEQRTVLLQDNTEIKLNTNSVVSVTYTDKQRLIELNKGEVYVDVAHNKELPLSVYADGNIIQAVGTAFNVEMYGNEIEVIVTDGKVLVGNQEQIDGSLLETANVKLSPKSFVITKGQKVQLLESLNTPKLVRDSGQDMIPELAWQKGQLIFEGESLIEAMQEVSRYTQLQFEFSHEELQETEIAGLFKTNDIDGLLKALEYNFDIVSEETSEGVMLLKKKSS